jgi:hypothetical protein
MSSEFERLLKRAQEALPAPEPEVTSRARAQALAAVLRRGRFRFRSPLLLAAALAGAVAVGVVVGVLATPSGTAAAGPEGLGFLPERGWSVYQAGTRASVAQPASAIVANVPLHSEDLAGGGASRLPYSTLLALPRNGVVIAADFTLLREHSVFTRRLFRARNLPLSLRDATPVDEFGAEIRPRRPLGQYQLRAAVKGYAVDVSFFFGSVRPSRTLLASAERQLKRLVVEPVEARARFEAPRITAALPSTPVSSAAARLIDRTFRCTLGVVAGTPKLEVGAAAGLRVRGRFERLAQATVDTFPENNFDERDALHIAGMTAGWPPPPSLGGPGGAGASLDQCTPVVATVPLRTSGLRGGPIDGFEDVYECFPVQKTIFVRLRVLFRSPKNLRLSLRGGRSLQARGRITRGELAARTSAGRPLFYAEIFESGKARFFTDRDCVIDPT